MAMIPYLNNIPPWAAYPLAYMGKGAIDYAGNRIQKSINKYLDGGKKSKGGKSGKKGGKGGDKAPKASSSSVKTFTSKESLITGQGTISHFVKTLKKASLATRIMSKLSAPSNWISNYTLRLEYAAGRQSHNSMLYYDAVPLVGQLSLLPAQNPAGNTSRRFLMDHMEAEYTMSNAGTATAYLKIYDIVYKRDMESAATDAEIFTPDLAWENGELEQGNAIGSALIGTDPRAVDKFKQFYSVLGLQTHFLRPGEVQKHKVVLNLNKFISENLITEKQRYRGLTHATMLVAYGVPCDDDSTPPVVTTSAGAIDITMTERCRYRWMEDLDFDTVVGSTFATAPATGVFEVVQDTGVVTAVTEA